MQVPVVNQCCCGCTLEVGTKIIGWLYVVGSVFMVAGSAILLLSPNSAQNQHSSGTVSEIFNLLCGIILLAASVLLLIGVSRRLARYLHYWIIIITIFMVITLLNGFIRTIQLFIAGAIGTGVSYLFMLLISTALTAYFVIIVVNFKREVSSENQQV